MARKNKIIQVPKLTPGKMAEVEAAIKFALALP